jgi:hypothetical protein
MKGKYDVINIAGVKIGDTFEDSVVILSKKYTRLTEEPHADKTIRYIVINYGNVEFLGRIYDNVQLKYKDNILISMIFNDAGKADKMPHVIKARNRELQNLFGNPEFERKKDEIYGDFYTDTLVSAIVVCGEIVNEEEKKAYMRTEIFDNISRLTENKSTYSNPIIKETIRKNLSLYRSEMLYGETHKDKESQSTSHRYDKIVKVFLLIIAIFFLYLFALNGRYEIYPGQLIIIDKWKKKVAVPNNDNVVKFKRHSY